MVAGGAGLTLLPSLSLEVESRRGELALRRFEAPAPSRTLVLAWRKQFPRSAALRKVAAALHGARGKNRHAPTGRGGSARPAAR